ncbi:MAG: sulfotransferase [Pseudomonadota bacterium]
MDFLIAGVQKAGTTALHRYLDAHPGLFLPKLKELHFFDTVQPGKRGIDSRGYEKFYRKNVDGLIAGEATPIYLFWPGALGLIHQYNPDVKLIVLLRHPVERAYSQWTMEHGKSHDSLSFSQAIREGRDRVCDSPWNLRRFSYVERGVYGEQIARLLALFDERQVLLIESADLTQKMQDTLDTVTDFIGVDRFEHYPQHEIVRPDQSKGPASPMVQEDYDYLSEVYGPDLERLRALTGRSFPTLD